MSERVFLHVGLPKSGTSYVQAVMRHEKSRLMSEAGLLFPGDAWTEQVRAVRDLREMRPRRRALGAWSGLVGEVHAWPGDSFVSMEWLCAAEPQHIRKAVADLAPAEVHALFTVRDLGRTLPAAWREFVQNRRDWAWESLVSAVTHGDTGQGSPGRAFWAQQDVTALLNRWGTVLGPDRIHLVTLPRPGSAPEVLWTRVASVVGFDQTRLPRTYPSVNESLGLESVEMLRRLNPLLREVGVSKPAYNHLLKAGVAKSVLAGRREQESSVRLPIPCRAAVRDLAQAQVEGIRAAGIHVVGDLDELLVEEEPSGAHGGKGGAEVSEAGVLTAALTGLAKVVRSWDDMDEDKELLRQESERLRRRLNGLEQRLERERRTSAILRAEVRHLQAHPLRVATTVTQGPFRRSKEALRRGLSASDQDERGTT